MAANAPGFNEEEEEDFFPETFKSPPVYRHNLHPNDKSGESERLMMANRHPKKLTFSDDVEVLESGIENNNGKSRTPSVGQQYQQNRHLSTTVKKLTYTVIILSLLLTIAIALAIIFVVLFFVGRIANESNMGPSKVVDNLQGGHGCDNIECVVSLNELKKSINMSVDPCEDFYAYACSHFIHNARLEPSESSRSSWDMNSQSIDISLSEILNSEVDIESFNNPTERKAFRFFKSCLNSGRVNRRGREKARSLISSIGTGDFYLLGSRNRGIVSGSMFPFASWNLEDNIVDLVTKSAFTVGLLGLVIHQDQRNISRNIVTIDAPNLTLGGRQLYLSNNSNSPYMVAYSKYVLRISNYFASRDNTGRRSKINEASIQAMIDFEKKIAEVCPDFFFFFF